ncbi:hypothetical protein M427DRAFT_60251, partial [Gonapodya prolifera JEL478]
MRSFYCRPKEPRRFQRTYKLLLVGFLGFGQRGRRSSGTVSGDGHYHTNQWRYRSQTTHFNTQYYNIPGAD